MSGMTYHIRWRVRGNERDDLLYPMESAWWNSSMVMRWNCVDASRLDCPCVRVMPKKESCSYHKRNTAHAQAHT